MEVYDRAVRSVADKDRYNVYSLYLARATQFFGVGKVRTLILMVLQDHWRLHSN